MVAANKKTDNKLLMPQATAIWLIENTALTFQQISDFTQIDVVQIESFANGDTGRGIVGRNPVEKKELTQEELDRCQNDPAASLIMAKNNLPPVKSRAKGPRYTPVSKRADKPNAIAYILKHDPDISDAQICKLVGTTKPTIQRIRDRSHPNISNIRPQHPADLGLCTYQEYEKSVDKGLKAAGKDPEAVKAERLAAQNSALNQREETESDSSSGGFDFSNFLPDIGGFGSTDNSENN